jgi:hypothetical protein
MIKSIIFAGFLALTFPQKKCAGDNKNKSCFKGRLEIKGICSNYTIKILEGKADTSKIAASWTDENTGKTYTNVFALDSPCSFPADIEQGGEFYFTIREQRDKDCQVCMAYYPTPPKRLSISVLKTPCP